VLSSKNNTGKDLWLEYGYKHFALHGPKNLSINKISQEIGSSRASFYHYFGDIDLFVEELLAMHWQIIERFNNAGDKHCSSLYPDLYIFLSNFKTELQFNIQLFHNRKNPTFNYLFLKSYYSSAKAFTLKLFIDHCNLKQSKSDIYNLWLTIGETWYSRLDPTDLSATTMQKISEEILQSVLNFIKSDLYSTLWQR